MDGFGIFSWMAFRSPISFVLQIDAIGHGACMQNCAAHDASRGILISPRTACVEICSAAQNHRVDPRKMFRRRRGHTSPAARREGLLSS